MKKVLSVFIIVCFLTSGPIGGFPVFAQDYVLPAPGLMVSPSPAFNPPILKGIKVHPDDPFKFDFILDQGDLYRGQLKQDATRLIKYFLAGLTIPEKDLWVNLSPYEKDRIIPQSFGLTEMGRDLLAEDYMLKQITASLIYPEGQIGKMFWKRVYEEAAQKFGTTNIPVNTFNKVWIVPEKAIVYENEKNGTAYVIEAKLKVMLEQDYLALEKTTQRKSLNALGSQVIREIVIPELSKEVNTGKNFTHLRQVYNSLILATWYKRKIKDSILNEVYADKNKLAGIRGRNDVGAIYQRYLAAFKKGVYNYIKEEQDPITQTALPRKYFSGGEELIDIDKAMQVTASPPQGLMEDQGNLSVVSSELNTENDAPHYKDTLDRLNAQYHPSYTDPSRLKQILDGRDFSKMTKPGRVKGLDELLSAYNEETLSQGSMNVVILGAGLRKASNDDFYSPQTTEIVKALKNSRSGKLYVTVVDRSPRVLGAAVSGVTGLSGFLGSFEDLNYGENNVDLMVATNSLYYSYFAMHQNKGLYLSLLIKLLKALKPSGKLLTDQPSLAAAMPGLQITKIDFEKLKAGMQGLEKELQGRGLPIKWRFYKDVVEIEKLPQADEAMLSFHLRGREVGPPSLWGDPMKTEDGALRKELIGLIDADVQKAYDYASKKFTGDVPGGIWAAGACRLVSNYLFNKFKGRDDFKIRVARYRTENKALARDADFHDFIIIFFKGHAWILDPTWQQFLKDGEETKNRPKILLVDVTLLDQKLDAMKALKENRHYWYSALSRDPVVMGMIRQMPLYRSFIPQVPRYYLTARSKLTPPGLFRFVQKCMDIGRDLPALNEFDDRVRMYTLNDRGFEVLLANLEEGMNKAPVQTRNHFRIARDYYQQVLKDRQEARPVTDVYDFVYSLFKKELLDAHEGLLEGLHSSIQVDKKSISVDSIGKQPDNPLFLRVGGIVFYNEEYKGFVQEVDEKFLGLQTYPLLNNLFPMTGASLDSVITSIAGLWVIKNSIQRRTVIDFHATNAIAGIVAKKLGAQDVIFVGGQQSQDNIYSSISQIPLDSRENAIVLMNESGETDIEKYILPIKPAFIITAGEFKEYAGALHDALAHAGYSSQTISGLSRSGRKPFVAFIANDQAMTAKAVNEGEYKGIFEEWISDLLDVPGDTTNPIFLFSGDLGAGKTTTANLFKEFLERRGLDAVVIHTDDFVNARSFRLRLLRRTMISNVLYVNQAKRARYINRVYAAIRYRDDFWRQIKSLKDPQHQEIRLATPREQFTVHDGTILIMEGPHTKNLFPSLVPTKEAFFQIAPSLQRRRITNRIMQQKGDSYLYASIKARLPKHHELLSFGSPTYDYLINVAPDGKLTMIKAGETGNDNSGFIKYLYEQHNGSLDIQKAVNIMGSYRKIVFEVGGGNGNVALALARKNPDIGVISTDNYDKNYLASLNKEMRAYNQYALLWKGHDLDAQKAGLDNLAVLRSGMDGLSRLPDNSLDYLLVANPIRPVLDGVFADAIWKKLKIGGKIVVKTHTSFSDYQRDNYELEHLHFERLGPEFLGVNINSVSDFGKESKEVNVYALTKTDGNKTLFELNTLSDVMDNAQLAALNPDTIQDIPLNGGADMMTLLSRRDLERIKRDYPNFYVRSIQGEPQLEGIVTPWDRNDASLENFDDYLRLTDIIRKVHRRDINKEIVLVDWGGGTGRGSIELHYKLQSEGIPHHIYVLSHDYLPNWQKAPKGMTFILDDAVNITKYLGPDSVDIIFSLRAISHFLKSTDFRIQSPDKTGHIDDLEWILKPGGVLRINGFFPDEIKLVMKNGGVANLWGKEFRLIPGVKGQNSFEFEKNTAIPMVQGGPGGIDLTAANMGLQTLNEGGGIKFRLDPAMLEKLQNAEGFVPVIINIQPMRDLKLFLGVANEKTAPLP